MKRIAIIGGGASGMFCAIQLLLKNSSLQVSIFEKMDRVGKKILSTGNGRCNITNENADKIEHYYGENVGFCEYALNLFKPNDLISFFNENNLILKKENDKYYPFSEQAGTILDFFRYKCTSLGAKIYTNTKIEKIENKNNIFIINNNEYDYVVVACGGKSSPHLGSDGSGYKLLEDFGHKKTDLYPAITQIKTENSFVKQLKGIKADANLSIFVDNKPIRTEFGQILFTDYGISGPPSFQLSHIAAKNYDKDCYVCLDFMPDYSENEVIELIYNSIYNPFTYPLNAENLLTLILNKRLGQVIIKYCGKNINDNAIEFDKKAIISIARAIKSFKLKVKGVNGFNNAQITYGGIKTEDFNCKTLESDFCKNLFSCGEILDINGDCGGFNLQWAFSSAYLVAMSIIGDIND